MALEWGDHWKHVNRDGLFAWPTTQEGEDLRSAICAVGLFDGYKGEGDVNVALMSLMSYFADNPPRATLAVLEMLNPTRRADPSVENFIVKAADYTIFGWDTEGDSTELSKSFFQAMEEGLRLVVDEERAMQLLVKLRATYEDWGFG